MAVLGELELLRPERLRPGVVEAVYAEAWGFDQRLPVERAELVVGGMAVPAVAIGIDRPDVAERHRAGPSRSAFAATSGLIFGGVVGPLDPGRHGAEVHLHLADGSRRVVAAGEIAVAAEPEPAPVVVPAGAELAIVMATFQPPAALFRRQVDSIRAQTYDRWCCIVCDDGSAPEYLEAMRDVLGDDERFALVANEQRIGFYLNFERALRQVPIELRYVALADQDDAWHPGKLARQVAVLEAEPAVQLVASDVRLTDPSGDVLAPTFYARRTPTHDDPYSLFVVNSLIGASMVLRRRLLDVALPFPRAFPDRFHDHWLGRAAASSGRVAFVPDALHDYVQHGENVFGSRDAVRWPIRPAIRASVRRWLGLGGPLPADWQRHFVEFPLECSVAAQLVVARFPQAATQPWLTRIRSLHEGQCRELTRIVVDHAREQRAPRPLRENVELLLFTGRSWLLGHQPEPSAP